MQKFRKFSRIISEHFKNNFKNNFELNFEKLCKVFRKFAWRNMHSAGSARCRFCGRKAVFREVIHGLFTFSFLSLLAVHLPHGRRFYKINNGRSCAQPMGIRFGWVAWRVVGTILKINGKSEINYDNIVSKNVGPRTRNLCEKFWPLHAPFMGVCIKSFTGKWLERSMCRAKRPKQSIIYLKTQYNNSKSSASGLYKNVCLS